MAAFFLAPHLIEEQQRNAGLPGSATKKTSESLLVLELTPFRGIGMPGHRAMRLAEFGARLKRLFFATCRNVRETISLDSAGRHFVRCFAC